MLILALRAETIPQAEVTLAATCDLRRGLQSEAVVAGRIGQLADGAVDHAGSAAEVLRRGRHRCHQTGTPVER